jgi:hypothetical protein
MKTRMYSVCLECNQIYDIKDGKGVSGISHGYCSKCGEIIMKQDKMEFNNELHK